MIPAMPSSTGTGSTRTPLAVICRSQLSGIVLGTANRIGIPVIRPSCPKERTRLPPE